MSVYELELLLVQSLTSEKDHYEYWTRTYLCFDAVPMEKVEQFKFHWPMYKIALEEATTNVLCFINYWHTVYMRGL